MPVRKKNELSKDCLKQYKYLSLVGAAGAALIALFVLFYPPMPGVADQGDFYRVMAVTGLGKVTTPDWYKYVTTEYKILPMNYTRLFGVIPTTSMIYPIFLARQAAIIIGSEYFSTKILALVYTVMYISSLYMCFKWLRFKRVATGIFFVALSLFILMDGNYLVWFNSLYGEPMMFTGLIIFISCFLYVSKHMEEINVKKILLLFMAALLFLGSKPQVFPALPFMLLIIFRIVSLQRDFVTSIEIKSIFLAASLMLIFYVGGIYLQTSFTTGIDTEYNSVFYGVLKGSEDPRADLRKLGLPEDMALEAGKHSYLPKNQYVKYVPRSELTLREFNDRISNFKLLKFYLSQPARLIKGMEYTASKAFDTGTSLGKFEKGEVKEYTPHLSRFTLWSNFRSTIMPRSLAFIVAFYALVILTSIIEYIRRKDDMESRLQIELLWLIIIIGLLQFPMPYIGNGEADTAKQLFLFNYTFDIVFIVVCTWIFNRAYVMLRR